MDVERFIHILDADFFTGVPDSQLKAMCDYLMDTYGIDPEHHIIAANEGNCTAIAAGYHLSTGKIPVVYMQNSGEGNIINPAASLLNDKVYAIPVIFVIGWRGEPGVHDEPQHIYQGEVTIKLLDDMGIQSYVLDKETSEESLQDKMREFRSLLSAGKDVAFVIRKGALTYDNKIKYQNQNSLCREEVIRHIISVSDSDPVICTTGKASRELFELREALHQGHQYDFLTVGSMGHSSSIALGIAINKPNQKIWCIDGDGAALMHMGALAVIGAYKPRNMVHILINNAAHETVGGMPTVSGSIDIPAIASACGYSKVFSAETFEELDEALTSAKEAQELCFIEIKCSLGSRSDLGRPTTTALENKQAFMHFLAEEPFFSHH